MTDRDRLIELHEEAGVEWDYYVDKCINEGKMPSKTYDEFHADHLLANGVTVLPLPIGSTVWEIRARGRRKIITSSRKCDYSIINDMYFKSAKEHNLEFYVKAKKFVKYDKTRWNKTVFATKDEAEAKLKELNKNG